MNFNSDPPHMLKKQPLLYADLFKTNQQTNCTSSIMSSADSNHSSSTFDSSSSSSASFTSDGDELTHQIPEEYCSMHMGMALQQEHKTSINHPNSVFKHNNKYRGEFNGSDMQVFFLGGSGSRSTSTGTGVFFPRVNNYGPVPAPAPVDPYLQQQKPGCTTVLIPTRVLKVLENLHFNKLLHSDSDSDSSLQTFTAGSTYNNYHPNNVKDGSNRPNAQEHVEEMELPQEWTY